MPARYILVSLFFCFLSFGWVNAQTSFTILPDTVFVVKPKTSFVFYFYARLTNLTGSDLPMRWVKTHTHIEQNGVVGTELGDWEYSIQDPTNIFSISESRADSADFLLPGLPSSLDKFIVYFHPNDVAGHLQVSFRVFPIANPSDSTTVVFDYTATDVSSTGMLDLPVDFLKLYPNPAADWVEVENSTTSDFAISIFGAFGQHLVGEFYLKPKQAQWIDLSNLGNGLYWLLVKSDKGQKLLPLVVQKG